MSFEFATAGRIVFGPGRAGELGSFAQTLGRRLALLTGRNSHRHPVIHESLAAAGVHVLPLAWTTEQSEPDLAFVIQLADQLRAAGADGIIGVGGGAVLDAAKAAAALATNPGDPFAYLEVIGQGLPLTQAPLPVLAVPTTAGTGSEVTRNAVINVLSHRAKVSVRHPQLLPRIALVDPRLTHSLSRGLTATTGMDALTQCLEPLVSVRANPLSDGVAWTGLKRAARSLRRACQDGSDAAAREDLSLASLCGGIALANAGLGAVHGLAGPLGGLYPAAPHGALCAALLAPVVRANIQALRTSSNPAHHAIQERYACIARILTGDPTADSEAGAEWLGQLTADLRIPPLSAFGIRADERPLIIEKALQASSMKGNPIPLSTTTLEQILSAAGLN